MVTKEIAVYGSGGFGREVAWLAQQCSGKEEAYRVVCFIEDDPKLQGQVVNTIPVLSLEEFITRHASACITLGIGLPTTRELIVRKLRSMGNPFVNLIHPGVESSQFIEYGSGIVICAGCILTTNIKVGNHVQINLDCTIGHDAVLGDYTTLAPGVHVSGWVHFGRRVYVGTGAVIINGSSSKPLTIGDDAVVGAGACVTRSVNANSTVVGVPARPLTRRS